MVYLDLTEEDFKHIDYYFSKSQFYTRMGLIISCRDLACNQCYFNGNCILGGGDDEFRRLLKERYIEWFI